jgi:UDP-N-acetylglucosamine:LPS N-acetylglucosamine transferase
MESSAAKQDKPKALVVLSGGGFSFETKRLLASIDKDFQFVYLKTKFSPEPGADEIPFGPSHSVPLFSTVTQKSLRRSINALMQTFFTTVRLLRRDEIEIIIAVGCSYAFPMLLAGRFFRRKTVFLESITRVDRLSNTGKLVYYMRLATIFLVQWPALQISYPSTKIGTIL